MKKYRCCETKIEHNISIMSIININADYFKLNKC